MMELVELLNGFGRWLAAHLWQMSIELAILAAVVLAVLYLLRIKSPAIRHLFWCLVLAKPVVTFLVASPVSLYWFLRPPMEELPPPPVVTPVVEYVRAPVARPAMPVRPRAVPPQPTVRVEPPSPWKNLDRYGAVGMVWLVVASALGLRLLIGFAYVSFLRQTATVQSKGPLADAVEQAATALKMRRPVRVAVSNVAHGPVLAGVIRPVILLPKTLVAELSPKQMKLIAAHELAHVRRRDNLLLLIQRFAEMFLFFHPVVWVCGWAMRREAEAACDDAVIAAYGGTREYADSLTRVAEMHYGLTRRLLVNTFAATESHFSQRVRRIVDGRVGRMTAGFSIVSLVVLIVIGCLGLPTASERKAKSAQKSKTEETERSMAKKTFEYGFRYDPMKFVEKDSSLRGALVRTVVFNQAKPEDGELIEAHFSAVFAKQKPDGSLEDPHNQGLLAATGAGLLELLEMGCSPERPEMKRAIAAIRKAVGDLKGEKAADISSYSLRALCMLGLTDLPAVKASLRKTADNMDNMLGQGCPWTPEVQLNALWAGREVVDVDAAIVKGLEWIDRNLEPPGCSAGLGLCEPWSMVQMVGVIDHPISRRIARKLVPMLLRVQERDGGWGEQENRTLRAFVALKKYGLLDELHKLPPLPPDWRVVRSIPAAGEKPRNIACVNNKLWVLDVGTWSAVAVSPNDGTVLNTVRIAKKPGMNHHGFGVGKGTFYLSAFGKKGERSDKIYGVDAETGGITQEMSLPATNRATGNAKVGRKLLVADGWEGGVWVIDLDRTDAEPERIRLAAGMPDYMTSHGDEIWAVDWFAPAMVRTNMKGELVDWGERPFGFNPVAWDGEHIWALDSANKRIHMIEKTESGKKLTEALKKQATTRKKGARKPGKDKKMTGKVNREDGKVWVEGVPDIKMTKGWMRLRGMEILLRHRGEEPSLTDLLVCSSEAFHLCHGTKWELRTGLCMWTNPWSNLAEAYGYASRWTPPSWFFAMERLKMKERWEKSNAFLEELWKSIDAGRPVLFGGAYGNCGTWRVAAGYEQGKKKICYVGGDKAYEWTDLIDKKVKELGFWDAQVQGPIAPEKFGYGGWLANAAFLLGEKKAQPSAREQALMAFRRAVETFHAPEFATKAYGSVTYYFGEKAYEQWAKDLHELDYPADLKKPRPKLPECYDMSNFAGQVNQIVTGRAAAADFCEKAVAALPKAKTHLLAAARAYREEAAIAKNAFPVFLTGTDKQREAWLSAEAKREAGVAAIRQMLERERAAVREIEKALAAEGVDVKALRKAKIEKQGTERQMEAKVKREGERVWIDGVPKLAWGKGKDCTFAGALEAATAVTEHPYSYSDIMGLSGLAFRTRWSRWQGKKEPGWCPSCAVGEMPDEHAAVEKLTGWSLPTDVQLGQEKPDMAKFVPKVVASIDSGKPVAVYGKCLDMAVAYGYEEDGRTLLLHDYNSPDDPFRLAGEKLGPMQTYLGEYRRPPSSRDALLDALTIAVRNWKRERHDGGVKGRDDWYGEAALKSWARDIANADTFPQEQKQVLCNVNTFVFMSLIDARSAAVKFLKEKAALLNEEAHKALDRAVAVYEEEVNLLRPVVEKKRPFLGDWSGKPLKDWTADVRKREQDVLSKACELEAKAMAEIEKALAAERVTVSAPATTSQRKFDYSRLKLEGNGHTQDSFALAVKAAAEFLGLQADYETIYCLSANAFTPAIDKGEDCTAWWHVQGWLGDTGMETVAGRLGLRAQRLEMPADDLSPKDPKDVFERKALKHRKACARIIRQAMGQGAVVLTDGGWKVRTDQGFAPWCWWGILTKADDDGTIQGTCLGADPRKALGYRDRPLDYVGGCWAISPGERTLAPHEADVNMLRNAVKRIRGDAERFGETERLAYGLPAMDAWIAKMRQTPFCGPCFESAPERVWTCALNNGQTAIAGAKTAASYLRKRKDTFAAEARPHIEATAKRYDQIVELLMPALTGKGGEHYKDFIGNLEKQEAHAKVLMQVKAELAAAADEMEKALKAEGIQVAAAPASFPAGKYPKSAMLKDVPYGKGNSDRYARGMSILLKYAGTPVDYDTVMGLSGVAFITQAQEGQPIIDGAVDVGWWPLAPWGFNMRAPFLERALGWEIRQLGGDVDAYKADPVQYYRDRFDQTVKAAIAGGRPVLAISDGSFVVHGYDEGDPPLLGNWSCNDEPKSIRIPDYPWALMLLGEKREAMGDKEVELEALGYAVALFKDDDGRTLCFCPFQRPSKHFTGRKSFALWTNALRDTEHLGQARWHANMVLHLKINRRSAVAYLRAMAKGRSEDTAKHLNASADFYEKVLGELKTADTSEAALIKSTKGREKLAQLVDRIAGLEAQAVDEIEKALAAEGVKVKGEVKPSLGQPPEDKEMAANVKQEDGKVWVTGVPAQRGKNTVLAAMASVLQSSGEDATYEYLMGVSSRAFRLQFNWCPSAPHSNCGFNTTEPALKAIGYKMTDYPLAMWSSETREQREPTATELKAARTAIKRCIDSGMPAMFGSEEEGILVGYEPAGEGTTGFLIRAGRDKPYLKSLEKFPWGVQVLAKSPEVSQRRERIVWSLQTAVQNAHAKKLGEGDGYSAGFAAWERWINELSDAEGPHWKGVKDTQPKPLDQLDKDDWFGVCLGNAWCYESLIDARQAAAKYLRSIATEFDEEAAPHLEKAAEQYEKVASTLEPGRKYARYPWMLKETGNWTKEMRQSQAKVMSKALPFEREAIAEIEKALKAEGIPIPAATRDFSDDEKKRLLQWENIFGWSLDKCLEGADRNPIIYELLGLELSLEPMSDEARAIRQAMKKLEPADLTYWSKVDAIVKAISAYPLPEGSLKKGELALPAPGWEERCEEIKKRAKALELWLNDTKLEAAKNADDADEAAVSQVYKLLGKASSDKKRLVTLLLEKMRTGGVSKEDIETVRKSKELGEFAHRIEMLDAPLWNYDNNLELLLRGIGQGRPVGEWHKPGGPMAWGDGNPADLPKVERGISALEAWLSGNPTDYELARTLGARDAYKEKEWLVRCLLTYLRDHRSNYYNFGDAADRSVVLLYEAVEAFDHMQKQIASHENWGDGVYPYPQPCVYLQMHWVEMHTAGWKDVDFDTLAAVSGASALFAYEPRQFRPKYANLFIGMDKRIAEATGFGYEWLKFDDPEEAWKIVKETIDAGRAVKGWHWENCAFVGYQDAAKAEDRKIYAVGDGPGTFSRWWTWKEFEEWLALVKKWNQWKLGRHTQRVGKLPAKDVAVRVMKDLVAWSTDPPEVCRKQFPKATFGSAGIEAYAADCANVAKYKDWAMCHGINPQWTVRNSTSLYLQSLADAKTFPRKTTEHIAAAAKEYKAAFGAWHRAYGLLGHGATKDQRQEKKRREAGAAAIRKALGHEKAAIANIKLALAAISD